MKLISTPKQLTSVMRKLIRKCARIRWAVAWASADFELCTLLKENEQKISKIVVGTHFFQTHPNFIEAFLDNNKVKFVLDTSSIFHPKVYLFEHDDDKWDCIIGSANFTKAAATRNKEVCIHISSKDADTQFAYQIKEQIDAFFKIGKKVTSEWLNGYRIQWKRHRNRIRVLSGSNSKNASPILQTELLMKEWSEYYKTVSHDEIHSVQGRLAVLEGSRKLFAEFESFGAIPEEGRLGIAGLITTEQIDWKWFGHMGAKGDFKQHLEDPNPNPHISAALAEIPLVGTISKENFDAYRKEIENAFDWKPNAIATRLLAMKRPDYFVCVDSKNKAILYDRLGIKKKSISLQSYWDQIIGRILQSNWWQSDEPTDEMERRIWKCRVAFLDVICYQPNQ